MKKRTIILVCIALFIRINGTAQDIVLNEVVYSNGSTLKDAEGDSPDWIELFNRGNVTIDLSGYQITDDTTEHEHWTFPNYLLEPGKYLIVFASGKDSKDIEELHTDFCLSQMNDPVFLLNTEGVLIDEVRVQCVPRDLSLGLQPDGVGERKVLVPTPGTSNNQADIVQINYVPDTLNINYESGFYNKPMELQLSNTHSVNTIKYTLNGDFPDENSPTYDGTPILVEDLTPNENRFANIPETIKEPGNDIFKANIIRATIFSAGCPASKTISNIYFINEKIKNKYEVPVVSIITEKDNLFDEEIGIYVDGNHNNYNQQGKEWERLAHIEIFDKKKKLIIDQDAGIRINGQGSRSAPQKSFRLYARTEYDKEYFEYPFFQQKFEIEKYRTLLLRSTRGLSGTLFKDELTQNLVQNMNIDYSGSETVIVFLNGEYWGIYNLRERLDEGYIENNFLIENPEPDIISHGVTQILLEEGNLDAYNELINLLTCADPSSENFYSELSNYVDIPELIDYFIAEMYFANYDFPHNNLKMWKAKTEGSKWRFYFYDCDACMINLKQDLFSELNSDIELLQVHEEFCTFIIKRFMQNNKFRDQFHTAFNYHLTNTFSPDRILSEINRFEKLYEPLAGEHTYRWYQPVDYIKWKKNVEMLKIFALQRPLFVKEQLLENFGKPYKIFPNPSTGSFTLDFVSEFNDLTIKIFDLKGILVDTRTFTCSESETLETELQPGIYTLQIFTDLNIYTDKITIK